MKVSHLSKLNIVKNLVYFFFIVCTALITLGTTKCGGPQEPKIRSPYKNSPYWYKVQLHAHTKRSDGKNSPSDVLNAYKNAGYKVMAITDHDSSCNEIHNTPIVPGILNIPAEEDGYSEDEHMGAIGLTRTTAPCGPLHSDPAQKRIDHVVNQGGIAILNHPYASHSWDESKVLNDLKNFHGIEIYNAGPFSTMNLDAMMLWADIADRGISKGRPVWGFATDDCHNIYSTSFNKGWIVVNSDKKFTQDIEFEDEIIEQIIAGNFYSVARDFYNWEHKSGLNNTDKGPAMNITVNNNTIHFSSDLICKNIYWQGEGKRTLKTDRQVKSSSYTLNGSEDFVRVSIFQNRKGEYYTAWSQPLFISGRTRVQGTLFRKNGSTYTRVANTTIKLRKDNDNSSTSVKTDSNGNFKIFTSKGTGKYHLNAFIPGYEGHSSFVLAHNEIKNRDLYMQKISNSK